MFKSDFHLVLHNLNVTTFVPYPLGVLLLSFLVSCPLSTRLSSYVFRYVTLVALPLVYIA